MVFMNEKQIIQYIRRETSKCNRDNISRTNAYKTYYINHPEIGWAYLANMVSRNAGWNMSDLWSKPFATLLNNEYRMQLFITYERANWMIFSDAFPQLLVYKWSKRTGVPFFYLLKHFYVSAWMSSQWEMFWHTRNENQLLDALIVNEQHLIQRPIINAPFFHKYTFKQFLYEWQERLHFSHVLLPTLNGRVFGRFVKNFTNVEKRIELGKQLSWILFKSKEKKEIKDYFLQSEYTGSRSDYQKFLRENLPYTPKLRIVYPFVHHEDEKREDWSQRCSYSPDYFLNKRFSRPKNEDITKWAIKKKQQLMIAAAIKQKLTLK